MGVRALADECERRHSPPDAVWDRVGGRVSATPTGLGRGTASWVASPRAFLAPLALAQFICSFAGSNMNVMINDISHDLHTDVKGVQTTITLFLLIMAVLMIPCSKLTDRWGRKRCFIGGLALYGIGNRSERDLARTWRADPWQLGVPGRRIGRGPREAA
jgi:hypothetical protein